MFLPRVSLSREDLSVIERRTVKRKAPIAAKGERCNYAENRNSGFVVVSCKWQKWGSGISWERSARICIEGIEFRRGFAGMREEREREREVSRGEGNE